MRSMVFEDSLFEECYFEDITSSNTFFKNCTFIATLFYNTGEQAALLFKVFILLSATSVQWVQQFVRCLNLLFFIAFFQQKK